MNTQILIYLIAHTYYSSRPRRSRRTYQEDGRAHLHLLLRAAKWFGLTLLLLQVVAVSRMKNFPNQSRCLSNGWMPHKSSIIARGMWPENTAEMEIVAVSSIVLVVLLLKETLTELE